MASTIASICLLAILVQAISASCIGNAYNNGINGISAAESAALSNSFGASSLGYGASLAANGLGYGAPYGANNPSHGLDGASSISSGGGFKVISSSPIAPTGLTVQSENLAFEGPLAVSGQLPFLGVVSVEGPLAAAGQGAVTYSCGDGSVGIVSEADSSAPGTAIGVGVGLTGLGYNGFGCGAVH